MILVDRGFDERRIVVEGKDSAEDPGKVLATVPGAGQVTDGSVTLVVAQRPSTVPDLVSAGTFDAAQERARSLGVAVDEKAQVDFTGTQTDGALVGQDPAPGAAYTGPVQLTVWRRPVVRWIDDMQPVTGSAELGTVEISGATYEHSVYDQLYVSSSSSSSTDRFSITFDLGGHYRYFSSRAGLTARSLGRTTIRFQVYVDERLAAEAEVRLGQPQDLLVDVNGAQRLRLVAYPVSRSGESGVEYPAFGSAKLLGTPAEVPGTRSTR